MAGKILFANIEQKSVSRVQRMDMACIGKKLNISLEYGLRKIDENSYLQCILLC